MILPPQPSLDCPPPDPNPRRPTFAVPDNACDCHAHTIGPALRYPFVADRSYTPPDATIESYLTVMTALGLRRSVIVQPSMHGTDNRAILEAIESVAEGGPEFRAIAVVPPETSEDQYLALHRRGVRGIRLNLIYQGGHSRFDQAEYFAERIAGLGWNLEILCDVSASTTALPQLQNLDIPIVFDHFGHLDAAKGVRDPGFLALVDLVQNGNAWVKLSGAYRITGRFYPYDDVRPFVDELLKVAPHRLLWGSDWPHTVCKVPMPNDGDLLDLLALWVQDRGLRHRILVDNPERLYGFTPALDG